MKTEALCGTHRPGAVSILNSLGATIRLRGPQHAVGGGGFASALRKGPETIATAGKVLSLGNQDRAAAAHE